MSKLLVHPRELKISRRTRQKIEAEGFILVPEDQEGSIRLLEPLPHFDVTDDSAWLVRTLLNIVVASDGYGGAKGKFNDALLKRLKERFDSEGEG